MTDLSGDDLAAALIADAQGTPEKKSSKMMPTIAAIGVLTLIAIGGGAGVGMLLGKAEAPAPAAEPAPAKAEVPTVEDPLTEAKGHGAQPVILPIPTLITNIATPPKTKIRMEASLLVTPREGEKTEALVAEIQGDTMLFLRTLDLAQIEGARGLLHLREDLLERARLRSPAVDDFLIRSLVAE